MKKFIDLARRPEVAKVLKDATSNPMVREAVASVASTLFEALKRRVESGRENVQTTVDECSVDDIESVEDDADLATVGEIQAQIEAVERVTVVFRHKANSRDVRNDRRGFVPYPYKRGFSYVFTVRDLIERRLRVIYADPNFVISVINRAGKVTPGGTKLRNARASD